MSKASECVKVVVRCRPLSKDEINDNRQCIVQVDTKRGEVKVKNPKNDPNEQQKMFTFDGAYDANSQQEVIYQETAYPIVESVLQGYNGTIFAYGQTGTGKTHTMEGKDEPPQMRGIIPRTFDHIFQTISGTPNVQFMVRASFLELYNEEVRDLLSKNDKKLEIREKPGVAVYVKDLSSFIIKDAVELKEKLEMGRDNRATGATKMNQDSSRSHSLFSITIEQIEKIENEDKIKVGKLNLVDLAGSERQSKTQATGDRFKEAININQSLTTLGNVISALIDPKSTHIPYRDSKLTRLLQDSLGGNTKTVMIANMGPADYNYDETLSTLRYANRAKSIKNKPKINEDPKDAMIRQYQEEITKLKQQLENAVAGDPGSHQIGETKVIEKIIHVEDKETILKIEQQLQQEKELIKQRSIEEKKKIELQKNLAEEQKIKLLKKLQEKEEAERIAKEKQEQLIKQIKKMEEKVISGNAEVDAAIKAERELLRAQQEIEEKKRAEQRLQEQNQELEEQTNVIKLKYKSQKEEVADKTQRIKNLSQKLKQIEQENKDLDEEYTKENEIELNRRRDLQMQMKKLKLILDYFIPEDEQQKILALAHLDEEKDIDNQWEIPFIELSGNNIHQKGKDQQQQNNQIDQEMQQILKLEQDGHHNVYFVYTDEGLIREEEIQSSDIVKKSRGSSASNKKRPTSKSQKKGSEDQILKKSQTQNSGQVQKQFPKSQEIVRGKGAQ